MDTKKIDTFMSHYQNMREDEIALIHANPNLSDEAKIALNTVISNRKIDLATIRQEDAEEEFQIDENRKAIAAAKEKRNASFLKGILIVGVPIIVLGAIFRPESTTQTLISTALQIPIIVVLVWLISVIKKRK